MKSEGMNKEPLISVIIPIYNAEKYLERCLDSIVGQTYQNLEIILVDDGSTDRSREICIRYEEQDLRVFLYSQENQGQSGARNTGLDRIKGEYIAFVDSDDWLEDTAIEVMYRKAKETGSEIVCTSYYKNYSARQVEVKIGNNATGTYFVEQNIILLLSSVLGYRSRVLDMRCVWGKLYHKSVVTESQCRFPEDLKKCEDIIFNLYAVQHAKQVCFFNAPVYHYRVRHASITDTLFSDQQAVSRQYYEKLQLYMEKFQLRDELQVPYHYAVIHNLLEISRLYGANIRTGWDFLKSVERLKQFSGEPECVQVITSSRIASMPECRTRVGLCLLKLRMYKMIMAICFFCGKIFSCFRR